MTRALLGLRYRITVSGLDAVAARGRDGILFLANHPALIDPAILLCLLVPRFQVRPVGDQDQIKRPLIGWVARRVRAIAIADPALAGAAARADIEAATSAAAAALAGGENLLVYPSGHLATSRYEDLRGNSGVHELLARAPDARVVLLRLHGLWGSRFSRAQTGTVPELGPVLQRCLLDLVKAGLVLLPRRQVVLTAVEPADLPRQADRATLNAFLERQLNQDAPPNQHVPYSLPSRGGNRCLADPVMLKAEHCQVTVPALVRTRVLDRLHELTGVAGINDDLHLARDLGCDSLVRAELVEWVGEELAEAGTKIAIDLDTVQTVADLLAVAAGSRPEAEAQQLTPVPVRWLDNDRRDHEPAVCEGATLIDAFLRRALAEPGTVILADQLSGLRSYRDLLTGIFVLRPLLARLPGARIGLMMPASVAADLLFLALLCAGKVPVMVNWTVGPRQVLQGLELTGTTVVLTARALVERLTGQGVSFAGFHDRFVYLEEMVGRISGPAKVIALVNALLRPRSLLRRVNPELAVILFTSGSEDRPKAVPLHHRHLLANLRDIAASVKFRHNDRLLSVLPPFHSFGLTAGMLMPLLNGIATVHSPNPRDGAMLAAMVAAYQVTLVGGTPTFLAAMADRAAAGQLLTLRLVVSGGEACPARVATALASSCPQATVLEGYGVTECAPIIAINTPDACRPGTVGRVLPSLDCQVIDLETGQPCQPGHKGLLLVSGPSVFDGYLGDRAASPFVERDGRRWYDTGDVVMADTDGFLHFRGRVRRFVKRGGEMISLPAIEAALDQYQAGSEQEGPVLAVLNHGDDGNGELVLYTTLALDRGQVNRQLRAAGLSPLHSLRRVVQVPLLPVLGTGKVDYRSLAEGCGSS